MGNNLIVVGDSLKKQFPKSRLVYNGIDFNLFKPVKGIKRIPNSVGFVNWKTEEYHYLEIKAVCEKLGKKFIVAEGIKYEDMPKFYSSIGAFISLPPPSTGFNLSWIEAIACGVPQVIGNDYGIGASLPITKVNNLSKIASVLSKRKNYNLPTIKQKYNVITQVVLLERIFSLKLGV
jgi:glycosyltransferase involved in cell wall biosynthesis